MLLKNKRCVRSTLFSKPLHSHEEGEIQLNPKHRKLCFWATSVSWAIPPHQAPTRALQVFMFSLLEDFEDYEFLEDFIFKPIRKKFNFWNAYTCIHSNHLLSNALFLFESNPETCDISHDGLPVLVWLGYYFWKKFDGELDQACVNI